MKITVWVVNTCCPDEPDPCLPSVYPTEAAARAYLDEMLRAEWTAHPPEDKETCEPLPYPGDAAEAHAMLEEWHGDKWGRWEVTGHQIDLGEALEASADAIALT